MFFWGAIFLINIVAAGILRIGVSEWLTDEDYAKLYDDDYYALTTTRFLVYALAEKHFNERNTTMFPALANLSACPHNISLIRVCDNHGIKSYSGSNVQELVEIDHVEAILGFTSADVAETGSIVAKSLDYVPIISTWATTNALSDKRHYPNFARVFPTDDQYITKLISLIDQFGYRQVGLLFYVTDGPQIASQILQEATKRSIRVVSVSCTYGDEKSIRAAVKTLAEREIQIIISAIYTYDVVTKLSHLAVEYNLVSSQLWIFYTLDYYPILRNANVSKLMEGSLLLTHQPFLDAAPTSSGKSYFYKNFIDNFTKMVTSEVVQLVNQKVPPFTNEYEYEWWGASCLESCTTSCLKAKFYDISNERIERFRKFISGGSNYPEVYDAMMAFGFAACMNHSKVATGRELFSNLMQVDFEGMSGKVRFDENGDRKNEDLQFVIRNWMRNENNTVVINPNQYPFDPESNQFIFDDTVYYRQRTSTPPLDILIPYHNENLLSSLSILGYGECAIINTLCVVSLIWTIIHRKTKIVVNSQPMFIIQVLLGILIASWSLIFMSFEEGSSLVDLNVACQVYPVLFFAGFQVAYVGLLFKTMRISILFNNSQLRKRRITLRKVLPFVGLTILVEFLIWITWTAIAPLSYSRLIRFSDINANPTDSVGICVTTSETGTIFLITMLILHALMLLGCAYAANRVKAAPTHLHESKYIALGVFSLCQAFFLTIPVLLAVYYNSQGRYLVLTSLVFLSCLFLWCSVILPKMYKHHTGKELVNFETTSEVPSPDVQRSNKVAVSSS